MYTIKSLNIHLKKSEKKTIKIKLKNVLKQFLYFLFEYLPDYTNPV